MVFDSKTIRTTVAEELHTRLGQKWFKPGSPRLEVASADNLTDFSIEFDCYAERRYGEYDSSLVAVFKWKKFAKLYKDFDQWYEIKDPGSAQFKTKSSRQQSKQFLRVSVDHVYSSFSAPGRRPFCAVDEQDVDGFITQCAADFDGKVGAWIRQWFTWASALNVMDGNKQLCGAWRDVAYFCLLEQVHGRAAACAWIGGVDATGWPEYLAAQVEYLQSQVCGEVVEQKDRDGGA
ncbi:MULTISPECIES: hypothetical protein [unclassified Mesorhizobium]|uniref:hypothetical protein n=1 Tax=unclassified Mesorhizobium TaxID=325217 RepID=UPI000F75124E|nr:MULTISPECIES: hypothetical protein [unclassified Mesorhizobium]AZO53714.1 hypothetical protein EJ077_09575 [Mesorhizobium sp. M8A.F.Ca.ET.057.01.1.1]RWE46080.1 MAG: hypothetical protein EOS80_15885 [Mesorhizobium sp.]